MEVPPGTILLDDSFGTGVINATDVPTAAIYESLTNEDRALFATFENWLGDIRPPSLNAENYGGYAHYGSGGPGGGAFNRRQGGLFSRDRYVTPAKVWDQMRLAYDALNSDDIVAGVAETTESLAFGGMSVFALDEDEEDVYNQVCANVDLDGRLREIWRDLFAVSQAYVAVWWEEQSFKVRGRTLAGNQRRKEITCIAPSELTLLDPLRVVPVGSSMFRQERLAYIATPSESLEFANILDGDSPAHDDIVTRLIVGPYTPSRAETQELEALGVPSTRDLWLLNPKNVFRHTLTRPSYSRVAPVRMKSVFELLDMKAQLRQMERAYLIGNTNFIVVITKGSDQLPAQPQEITNLQSMVRSLARVPVIVGDHRLNVEIVTPKLDNTLRAERWNTIDSRISGRLLQLLVLGGYSAGAPGDDSIKLVKVIARGMESRRHMIRRTLERNIFRPLLEKNESLSSLPQLQFHPRNIALDFDAAYASFLFDLRQSNEISRETILNQFDLSEDLEAELRKRERVEFDAIFMTQVPFSTPNRANPDETVVPDEPVPAPAPAPVPPKRRQRDNGGGRRNGGGAAPGTGQGESPRRRPVRPAASDNRNDHTPIQRQPPEGDDDADADAT